MFRKLIANLSMAFIVFPFLISFRHWDNILNCTYKVEDMYFDSFWEYIIYITFYPLFPFLFLLLILVPFQLIKEFFNMKGRPLSLWIKCIVFSFLFMICYAVLSRGYLGYAMRYRSMDFWGPILVAGIIFPISLYFLVDRYAEKSKSSSV